MEKNNNSINEDAFSRKDSTIINPLFKPKGSDFGRKENAYHMV